MQFLKISEDTTLAQLSERVRSRNLEHILAVNGLQRSPQVGRQFASLQRSVLQNSAISEPSTAKKQNLLNTFTGDSDIFESAALLNSEGWKILSTTNTLPGMLRIPDSIELPDAVDLLGNREPVSKRIYQKVMSSLDDTGTVDPSIFNQYSTIRPATILNFSGQPSQTFQWFRIPWGDITLYSSISQESMDIPCYPEELEDGVVANYATMPDMIYQYEPWQVYASSGPRNCKYTFEIHRDMWTGDHRDGLANKLIRFCEANCYPEYNGAAVNTATVTLYIKGSPLITGILTDVSVHWSGPIGLDGWYLFFKLELSITEVSEVALDYSTVRNKPLIG